MLPGINYGQFINTNMSQAGYRINTPVQTPAQTYIPQVQKPQINGERGDVLQLGREQQLQSLQTRQKSELGFLEQVFKNLGIFQPQLVQTAMKNNPRIMEICQQYGLSGKVDGKNLDDTSKHSSATAKYAVQIAKYMSFNEEDMVNV